MGDGRDIDMDILSQTTDWADGAEARYANRIEVTADDAAGEMVVRGAGRRRGRVPLATPEERRVIRNLRDQMRATAEYDKPITSRFKTPKPAAPALDDPEALVPCPVCRGEWGECEACFGDGVMTARQAAGLE